MDKTLASEEKELRDWMAVNCPNANPDRSMFSVVLEALKTYKANALYHSERSHLETILRDFKQWGEWFVANAPRIEQAVEKLKELEKLRG